MCLLCTQENNLFYQRFFLFLLFLQGHFLLLQFFLRISFSFSIFFHLSYTTFSPLFCMTTTIIINWQKMRKKICKYLGLNVLMPQNTVLSTLDKFWSRGCCRPGNITSTRAMWDLSLKKRKKSLRFFFSGYCKQSGK